MASELTSGDLTTIQTEKQTCIICIHASWSLPSQRIIKTFKNLNHPENIKFYLLDVDTKSDDLYERVVEKYRINIIPTFITFKGGQKSESTVKGAREETLQALVKELSNPTPDSTK